MVSLSFVFWMYVVLFSIIGGMRGWAKELMVSFSVILAMTFTTLLSNYVPFIRDVLQKDNQIFSSGYEPLSWACWFSLVIRHPIFRVLHPR